jgi:hypothetical protein
LFGYSPSPSNSYTTYCIYIQLVLTIRIQIWLGKIDNTMLLVYAQGKLTVMTALQSSVIIVLLVDSVTCVDATRASMPPYNLRAAWLGIAGVLFLGNLSPTPSCLGAALCPRRAADRQEQYTSPCHTASHLARCMNSRHGGRGYREHYNQLLPGCS